MRKISFKNRMVIFGMVLLLLGMAGCTNANEKKEESALPDVTDVTVDDVKKDQLILAIGGEPDDGFDPVTGWGRYGSSLFQSTLLKRNASFDVENDLAENYNVSEDGLIWTVDLREGVTFSDGESLTAEDVVFTFQTAKESGSVVDLNNLKEVKATGELSVQFILNKSQSTFLQSLIVTAIVPKHAYDGQYRENPIGSGPYTFVQWDKGQQLIVEANPNYYGEKPFFKKLTFLFLSEDAAYAAAKTGDVDIVSIPASFAHQTVTGMNLIELASVDNRGVTFPVVPDEGKLTEQGGKIGNNVTSDPAIRHAINVAVDREVLVDGVLEGFGTPAYSVSDGLPWWNDETVIEDGDTELAKSILAEAGWQDSGDGVLEKDGIKAEFTLLYPASDQTRQSLSIALADMLVEIGIKVNAEGKSWDELEMLKHANPAMMGWGSHDPLEMYNLFSTNTIGADWFNLGYYSNETVDSYMEQALRSTDEEEAFEYWKKAQWDGTTGFSAKGDAPWAWLVNLNHLYLVKDGLNIGDQKIQPHAHGWPITDNISEWHWKE